MKKTLLPLLLLLLCSACAQTSTMLGALDRVTGTPKIEQPAPPGFGSMGRFMGRTFVAGTTVLAVSASDNGKTMTIGDFSFRYTPTGQLAVSNPKLEKLGARIAPDGAVLAEGESWDFAYKYRFEPNEYGGFTESSESKSLAGINFLSSYEYRDRRDFMPYNEANVRAEAANKAYRDREAAQNALEARAARRESDRALANAYNTNLASLAASNAQQAQANSRNNAMLANLNAQAEAQRQAQAQQAQRRAAEQQREMQEKNARWKADKEQAAAQHRQATANAQAERATQRATQQREDQDRKNRLQAEREREREQQQRQVQGQLRVAEQQRAAVPQQSAPAPRRPDPVATGTSYPPAVAKDLNCLTEGECRKACPPRVKDNPKIQRDCLSACSRRSSCKVSYQ